LFGNEQWERLRSEFRTFHSVTNQFLLRASAPPRDIFLVLVFFLSGFAVAASPPSQVRNFVACPIVRDTQTVPCWLAEYDGELYYLGIQTDISADWYPPYLGHRVLVEGTATEDYRICGGIVLKPLVTSSLPELDASCNSQVLPAEDRYTVPFAPRGPGPSKGSLAFGNARPSPPILQPPFEAKQFVVPYEFDWPWVTGKTSRVVQQAVRYAQTIKSSKIEIVGYRGATLLSDGKLFVEQAGIGERRAKQVKQLLSEVGISESTLDVQWRDQAEVANGLRDYDSRRVIISVKP
jgi:outer membrane protein OmpA-like peptidoglycan-associated protein